ncbi:regulatory inactivation of DnaA Hda protein [Paracandidimonas soli]|uniref:Regulatory inactivation of DnaA Hda protein n=2 Tax=Paracandidimonas soli TaxID=1917182 RepID=A0A4R3VHE3_9BURK|nr:regulatory inactivation of DnaA Hda protein [Paracandidimonas soli]
MQKVDFTMNRPTSGFSAKRMTQQLILDVLTAPAPSLENFIVGPNGEALQWLTDSPGGRAAHLWGPPGVGRSHLLQALAATPGARYFDPSSPAAEIMALATADTLDVTRVAIDDVDKLDDNAQAALFALYNRWREVSATAQAFFLATSGDHAPMATPLREDLRTRLGWDLVFRLEPLSDEDRAQALRTRAGERGLSLSPDIIQWLLTHHSRDMRGLSALVDSLDRYSLATHRAITLPLLKDLLAKQRTNEQHS